MSDAYEIMQERKRAYQLAFTSPAGEAVMKDLTWFCRGDTTTFEDDARRHAFYEGRRDVWMRIQRHLKLSTEQLLEIYALKKAETESD